MSLILAGGNKDFLILGGEQRAMSKDGYVISEQFRKVYRINEDLMVAFAGKIRYCEEILNPVRQYDKDDTNPFVNVEISYDIENMVENVKQKLLGTKDEDCFFGIILCGKMLHRKPKDSERNPFFMHTYIYNGKLSVSRRLFKDGGIRWSALYGNSYNHMKFCKETFQKKLVLNLEDTKEVFDLTFENGAKHDRTVNNQVIYEILEQ